MPLNWNVSNIKNQDTLCWVGEEGKETMHHATNALIWATMAVDLGEITEANWAEFFARCQLSEKLFGADRHNSDGPVFITAEEVKAHIGLTTNVSNKTKRNWASRTGIQFIDEAVRKAQR